jgi:DNA repair exonuclease SbcCD nuclease subunit
MTRHFLGAEAQARFTAARLEAVGAIGALAVAEGCEFVVVCGDVFETNHVERQVVVRALEALRATPDVTFYLLPGNHDPLDAASVFRSPTFLEHCPPNVVVLHEAGVVEVAPGVELLAAPWVNKRPLTDLVARARADAAGPEPGTVRIAVGHGAIDSLSPDPTNPALVGLADLEAALTAGQLHYVALGDRHSTTQVGTSGRVWYSGAPEATDYIEVDPGNVLLVDVDAATCTVEPRRVGRWHFVARRVELSGPADIEALAAFLDDLADKSRTIVKLALVGQLSLALKDELDRVLEHHTDLLAALEHWERHTDLVVLPDEGDFDELQLSGFAHDALDDLRALAPGSDASADSARDALGLLFRLASADR